MCLFLLVFCKEISRLDKENEDPNLVLVMQISKDVAKNLIDERKFKEIKCDTIEKFISESRVDVTKIQEALDMSGLRKNGYALTFNIVSSTFKDQQIKCVVTHPNSSVVGKRSSKSRNR